MIIKRGKEKSVTGDFLSLSQWPRRWKPPSSTSCGAAARQLLLQYVFLKHELCWRNDALFDRVVFDVLCWKSAADLRLFFSVSTGVQRWVFRDELNVVLLSYKVNVWIMEILLKQELCWRNDALFDWAVFDVLCWKSTADLRLFFVSAGVQRWVFRDEFNVVLNEYLNVSNLNI